MSICAICGSELKQEGLDCPECGENIDIEIESEADVGSPFEDVRAELRIARLGFHWMYISLLLMIALITCGLVLTQMLTKEQARDVAILAICGFTLLGWIGVVCCLFIAEVLGAKPYLICCLGTGTLNFGVMVAEFSTDMPPFVVILNIVMSFVGGICFFRFTGELAWFLDRPGLDALSRRSLWAFVAFFLSTGAYFLASRFNEIAGVIAGSLQFLSFVWILWLIFRLLRGFRSALDLILEA